MFLAKPVEGVEPAAVPRLHGGVLWTLAAATLVLGVWWGRLYDLAEKAGAEILR